MNDLAATGPRDAWAVAQVCGPHCGVGSGRLVVEHWDGMTWQRLPALPGRALHAQNGFVAASGATDAWVLAEFDHGADALHWNGRRWQAFQAPACGLVFPAVFAPDDAWAFSDGYRACASHFDGHGWHKVRLPGIPGAVSAVSGDDIWVLGAAPAHGQRNAAPSSPGGGILAMHWNGHAWSAIDGPNVTLGADQHPVGGQITAVGPRDVWIEFGIQTDANPRLTELLAHWDGTTWHRIRMPAKSYGVWSMAPDGAGGLWLTAQGADPAGATWFFYHLRGGRLVAVPAPVEKRMTPLLDIGHVAWIPGTTSLWGIETVSSGTNGSQVALLRYDRH